MVTPSLVMVGAPHFLSMTTLRPLGPSVTLTASARASTPRWSESRAPHAGPVAADHGHGALVGKLAGDSAAGARRDPREVHQLRAVHRGLRGARALRRRAAGGARRSARRVVSLRI